MDWLPELVAENEVAIGIGIAGEVPLEELLAEIETRQAKEAKASRPIRVMTFEV